MIPIIKFITLNFLLFSTFWTIAQNEGNIWYFGNNAGIDFNSGSPVALSNGQLSTIEGCATICDNLGNLLFYTDGIDVYNRNHIIMPNGTGLSGHTSSSQSAIIIQKPGSNTIYLIFTVGVPGSSNGLRYSEVDMSLQGGLGDINSVHNIPVYSPTCEKIAIIQHQNGIDYWVTTHEFMTNGFRSYLLNSSGLSNSSIISNIGLVINNIQSGQGYLRVNARGDKIAAAICGANTSYVQLFDFDNSTGTLSNNLTIPAEKAYGIEFSPSGQYLYVSQSGASNNILQYNLQAGTNSDIINSQIIVGTSAPSYGGALQIAPDGVIYQAQSSANFLGTISNPDIGGTGCNFNRNGFQLSSQTNSLLGLPTFHNGITSHFINTSNINEEIINSINIYPNPVLDRFIISNDFGSAITLTIYNSYQKVVFKGKCSIGLTAIDFSNFSSGVYIASVIADDRILTKKVVKL